MSMVKLPATRLMTLCHWQVDGLRRQDSAVASDSPSSLPSLHSPPPAGPAEKTFDTQFFSWCCRTFEESVMMEFNAGSSAPGSQLPHDVSKHPQAPAPRNVAILAATNWCHSHYSGNFCMSIMSRWSRWLWTNIWRLPTLPSRRRYSPIRWTRCLLCCGFTRTMSVLLWLTLIVCGKLALCSPYGYPWLW